VPVGNYRSGGFVTTSLYSYKVNQRSPRRCSGQASLVNLFCISGYYLNNKRRLMSIEPREKVRFSFCRYNRYKLPSVFAPIEGIGTTPGQEVWVRFGFVFGINVRFWAENEDIWVRFAKKVLDT
jgi:hypothetical protein